MLAHSAQSITEWKEQRETMPGCHPSDPTIVLQDYATRPRSIDLSRRPTLTEDVLPVLTKDEPVGGNLAVNTCTYGAPQKQFQKSHSSVHRLVHPCMSASNQAESQADHGALHGYRDSMYYPAAHQDPNPNSTYALATPMAVRSPQQPRTHDCLVANANDDIESGLGSSTSSGRNSTGSLVRGAGESVLAGIDWAGGKLANLFGISQPKYQWAIDEHEILRKQAKAEVELDRLAKSSQFFNQQYGV